MRFCSCSWLLSQPDVGNADGPFPQITILFTTLGGAMKRIALVVLFVTFWCGAVHGQAKWGGLARQIAMGGSSAGQGLVVNPYIWDDPTLLLINPAYQTMYRDYFWTNIGGGTLAGLTTVDNGYGLQNAGINFELSKEFAVGVILSYDPSFANTASTLIQGTVGLGFGGFGLSIAQRAPQPIPQIANVWEAFASYDAGTVNFGFGFMYGNANSDSSVTTSTTSSSKEASARVFGFRGGALVDLGGGNALDVSAALRLDKATDKIAITPPPTTSTDGEYSVSGTEFQVQARAKVKLSNRVNLVPFGAFASLSGEPKEDTKPSAATRTTPRSLKASVTALAFGAGTEYKTKDIFLATGVSFFMARGKVEYGQDSLGGVPALTITGTIKNTAIPVFNLGGEWWFLEWLAGRAGYYRTLGKTKLTIETTTAGATTTFESNLTTPSSFLLFGNYPGDGIVTLGVGLRFGNFSLDATVSEEALRRGLGLVGSNDNINTFGYMNASFNFH